MAELESAFAAVIAEINRLKRVETAAQAVVSDYDYYGGSALYESIRELRTALEKKQ